MYILKVKIYSAYPVYNGKRNNTRSLDHVRQGGLVVNSASPNPVYTSRSIRNENKMAIKPSFGKTTQNNKCVEHPHTVERLDVRFLV